jgi:hypothetical protein
MLKVVLTNTFKPCLDRHGNEYPDYFVTQDGQILSLKLKAPLIRKQVLGNHGYLTLLLRDRNSKKVCECVHVLTARTWLRMPEDGLEVNHKDGVKTHNHYTNLEWITHGENCQHFVRLGLRAPYQHSHGEGHYKARLTESSVREIRLLNASGLSRSEIAKKYNVSTSAIEHLVQGRTWRHVA